MGKIQKRMDKQNRFYKIKKWWKEMIRRWKAKTPARAKKIQQNSYTLATALASGWALAQGINTVSIPAWVGIAVFSLVFILGTIGTRKGFEEEKKDDFKQ